MTTAGPHVIIIGGGASGALLAMSLLRASNLTTVTIIEPRPLLARGFAYGEAAPFHLLNVRAANMSAYHDMPDHFVAWLDRNGITDGVSGEGHFRFVSRRVYGDYLAEQLSSLALLGGRLRHIRSEVGSLTRSNAGVDVTLADGRGIRGDVAVVATGYAQKQPSGLPRRLPSWTSLASQSLADVDDILILGTGHSAIDHVQLLLASGYAGRITLMSRHGFLPAVHKPVEPVHIDAREVPFGARFSHVWRWFRRRAAEAERAGGDWRAVLDGLRPHAQKFWQSLATEEQKRFIRHARAWYDVRRHRLAPSIAGVLDRLRTEDRLQVIGGRIVSFAHAGRDAEIVYRLRGQCDKRVLMVQGIIECTGFDLNPQTSRNPFLKDLLAQGLAQMGPHGFGLRVSPSCALIDAEGKVASDLFAVGPLTRGQVWEAVGLPDIRQQCVSLALMLTEARYGGPTATALVS